jgi:transcriptional regulator with XRE-family HTH domain
MPTFLGTYLRRLALKNGWNALDISKKTDLSHGAVMRLLNDCDPRSAQPVDPRWSTLKALAMAFDVPVEAMAIACDGRDPDDDRNMAEAKKEQVLKDMLSKMQDLMGGTPPNHPGG